jgi:pilus assembly protein Flp/PilA
MASTLVYSTLVTRIDKIVTYFVPYSKSQKENHMFNSLLFQAKEKGQGLVEYALIIALIAVVIALFLPNVTTAIQGVFARIVAGIGG